MREAQKLLALFVPMIDWTTFRRVNRNEEVRVTRHGVAAFACSDESQAVVYLMRRDSIRADGVLDPQAEPVRTEVRVPGLKPGGYRVQAFDPITTGALEHEAVGLFSPGDDLRFETPPFRREIVFAIRRVSDRTSPS